MNIGALERSASLLGEVALEPASWPNLLQRISEAAGAYGAVLLQSGVPTTDVPWSPSLGRMREVYYRDGWNTRDLRAIRSVAAVKRGLTVLDDEDLVSRDEASHDPYYTSYLGSLGLTTFAAVAFRASISDFWGLVLLRTTSQGVFDKREKRALSLLAPRLTATAELARMLGEVSLRSSLKVLDALPRPALVLGAAAKVIDVNAAAAAIFDDDFRVQRGRMLIRDDRASEQVRRACEGTHAMFDATVRTSEPIVVRREGRMPLVLRLLPLDGPAGSFFLGACSLVTIWDPGAVSLPTPGLLRIAFGMTGSEARLAIHLSAGLSLREVADVSGITFETARSQLRTVFAKTGTCRQAELLALLSRL